jgi:hypothetical protein
MSNSSTISGDQEKEASTNFVFGSKYKILNSPYTSFRILHDMLSSPEISSSTIIKTAPALEKAVTDNATLSFYKSSSSTINQTAPIVEKAATNDATLSSCKISSSTIIQTACVVKRAVTNHDTFSSSQPTNSHTFGSPSQLGVGVCPSTTMSAITVFGVGGTSTADTTNFRSLSYAVKRRRKQEDK